MKHSFTEPNLEIVLLSNEDVICTSGKCGGGDVVMNPEETE